MAKPLRIDVSTTSNDKGLVESAIAMNKLADEADKVGNQFKETAVDGGILAAELDRVKRKQLELAAAFDATGEKSLLKQISANQRYESTLKRVEKELGNVAGGVENEAAKLAQSGEKAGNLFTKGLDSAMQAAPPQAMGLLGVGLVAAAPVLGVMVGGALLAGIGSVGIGAGIAAELKDPRVHAALQGLKSDIGSTLRDAAKPFIGPTVAAFNDIGSIVKSDIGPGLKSMFAELAPELGGLAHGFGTFVSKVATGFEHAAIAAKPLLAVLGSQLLPQLGDSLKSMFDTIGRHAPEAEQGLKLLFAAIEVGIGIVNVAINVFSALFDGIEHAFLYTTEAVNFFTGGLDGAVGAMKDFIAGNDAGTTGMALASAAAGALGGSLDTTKQKTQDLNKAWDDLTKALSADQGEIDARNQIDSVAGALDKNSKSISLNSQVGRDNRSMLDEKIAALGRDRDALIANGMSVTDANKKYNGWVKALEAAAVKAGVSTSAIEDLNRQLGLVPRTIPITFKIKHTGQSGVDITPSGIRFFAAGGRYQAGQPRVVGENGPELDIPDHGGVIVPRVPSAMPNSGGGGGGGGSTLIGFDTNGDALVAAILAALRPVIRTQYAGDVSAALGGAR